MHSSDGLPLLQGAFHFSDTPELKIFLFCDNQDVLPKQREVYFSIDPLHKLCLKQIHRTEMK